MNTGYWDIHNHILPGLDDGSSSEEESFLLLKSEQEQGVRNIIFTPHFRAGMFTVPAETREETYEEFTEEARKRFPDMNFFLGCELHVHRDMAELISDERCRMAGGRYVLTEFSTNTPLSTIAHTLHIIQQEDCIPIIAHAERCTELADDIDALLDFHDEGVMIQVNADTILEGMFSPRKKFAKKLLEFDVIDFLGSDAHDPHYRPVRLQEAARAIEKKYGSETINKILISNPENLIKG